MGFFNSLMQRRKQEQQPLQQMPWNQQKQLAGRPVSPEQAPQPAQQGGIPGGGGVQGRLLERLKMQEYARQRNLAEQPQLQRCPTCGK